MKTLSPDAVRGLMIAAQGLHNHLQPRATQKAVRSIIRQMHLLQMVADNALVAEVKSALQACAAWHKTPQVVVRYAAKPGLAKRLSD